MKDSIDLYFLHFESEQSFLFQDKIFFSEFNVGIYCCSTNNSECY